MILILLFVVNLVSENVRCREFICVREDGQVQVSNDLDLTWW